MKWRRRTGREMQTYLIAGGSGFIGSHLADALLGNGHSVIIVDNQITGSVKNINHLDSNPNFTYIEHDVIFPITGISEKVNGIFHFASPASPNKNNEKSYINFPIETLLVNSQGSYNLLRFAQEKGARFVYASSSEVYGDPAVSPQSEDYWGNVNPNGVRSVYDEGKRFGEAISMAFFRKHNVDIRVIRIFNTYGPRMQKDDGRVVSNFINQALERRNLTVYGDGSQTRSFCYIDDLVEGIVGIMMKDEIGGEVINLGNPEEHTILDAAHMVQRLVGGDTDIEFFELPEDDPTRRRPDIAKAQRLIGFQPKISFEEGLKKTIEYFRANG